MLIVKTKHMTNIDVVAKLLGVKLGEPFKLTKTDRHGRTKSIVNRGSYCLSPDGLMYTSEGDRARHKSLALNYLLAGKYQVVKLDA